MRSTVRIAIIGGGIAGAAAAHAVRKRLPDAAIVILEGSDRLGGMLSVVEIAGVAVDVGAEAILNLRPEGVALARAVGLADRVVHPAATTAGIWTRGAVRPMPPTVMGVPTGIAALAESGVISRRGLLRVRADVPRRAPRKDISVGDYVRSRVGSEIVDRLVEPLLGGIYAGHAAHLSLQAAAPQIAALASQGGSLVHAAAASKKQAERAASGKPEPVFAGLVGGVGQLPGAVVDAAGAQVRLKATVRELRRIDESGRWRLTVGPTAEPESVDVDAVIIAAPAAAAARLVAVTSPAAARQLRGIDYASMAIVTAAIAVNESVEGIAGSGFLVPPIDGRSIKAATYSSRKWGWLGEAAPGSLLVRTSIGRAGETALLQREDSELISLAMEDLSAAVGLRGPLIDAHVQRWGGALPQYNVGHVDRVDAIDAAIADVPGLEVCGAAYRGVGVPAVIATAQAAAGRVADHLRLAAGRAGQ